VLCWLSFVSAPRDYRPAVLAAWSAVFYLAYGHAPLVFALIVAVFLLTPRFPAAAAALVFAALAFYKTRAVPLGLSFLAFELWHFTIERRRGRIASAGIGDFLAYALFFPCRIAGPIKRYPEFVAAMRAAGPTVGDVYVGFVRILVGIAKK